MTEEKKSSLGRSYSLSAKRIISSPSPLKKKRDPTFYESTPDIVGKEEKDKILLNQASILAAISESKILVDKHSNDTNVGVPQSHTGHLRKAKSIHPLRLPPPAIADNKIDNSKSLEAQLEKSRTQIDTLEKTIDVLNASKGGETDIEHLKIENIKLIAERDAALKNIEELTAVNRILEKEIEEMDLELRQTPEDSIETTSLIGKLTEEKHTLQRQCDELSTQLKRLVHTIESTTSDLSSKVLRLSDENKRLLNFNSELEEENLMLHEHLEKVEKSSKDLAIDNDTLVMKLAELGYRVRIKDEKLIIEDKDSPVEELHGLSIDDLLNI